MLNMWIVEVLRDVATFADKNNLQKTGEILQDAIFAAFDEVNLVGMVEQPSISINEYCEIAECFQPRIALPDGEAQPA